MKVLIYGEPYKWAMACNIIEALHELGHKADLFDYTQKLFRTKKFSLPNRILDRILFGYVAKTISTNLLKTIKGDQYDVLLVLKGVHILPETIDMAKQHVKHVVNWNPDDFFNPLNNSRYLLAAFKKFDCIFTPRSHLVDEYVRKGAKKVELLHWYYLPKYQYPVDVSSEEKDQFGSDVVFIGTWSPRREEFLNSLQGLNLRIWGSHWHRASSDFRKRFDCRPPIFGENLSKVVSSSKININILTIENRDTTNIRNFEIPACAGFQLCERSPVIMQLFEDDQEIAFYSTPDELKAQCIFYLSNEHQREQIRLAGYRRLTKDRHAMKDRVNSIVSTLHA